MNPELDLTISRVIRAPRDAVWDAWADPRKLEQWWVPKPSVGRVVNLDLVPGGSFLTEISENKGEFAGHIDGCFLDVVPNERIVFTTALVGGWRPAENPFITAIITFADHPDGTQYNSLVMHKNPADREAHIGYGFYDGWGTVIGQLAERFEG
jgi:uncharacterized protein YndB with AHSA1/START domain